MRIPVLILSCGLLLGSAAIPANVGDDHPVLENYTINNVAPYHGPWLNINSYNGKGMVVVHWKRS